MKNSFVNLVLASEEFDQGYQCPYCNRVNICTDCQGFEKIVDLKDGLEIYRHSKKHENEKQNVETSSELETNENGFIIHNTKDTDIQSKDFLPELENKVIQCARCRQAIEQAVKIVKNIAAISKKEITGICDHCTLSERPCYKCEEAIKRFFQNKTGAKETVSTKQGMQHEFKGDEADKNEHDRNHLKESIEETEQKSGTKKPTLDSKQSKTDLKQTKAGTKPPKPELDKGPKTDIKPTKSESKQPKSELEKEPKTAVKQSKTKPKSELEKGADKKSQSIIRPDEMKGTKTGSTKPKDDSKKSETVLKRPEKSSKDKSGPKAQSQSKENKDEIKLDKIKMKAASTVMKEPNIGISIGKKRDEDFNKKRGNEIITGEITPQILTHEKEHKSLKPRRCPMCIDSDLELEYESRKKPSVEKGEMILGLKIKYITGHTKHTESESIKPILFQIKYDNKFRSETNEPPKHIAVFKESVEKPKQSINLPEEENKGVIRYALSDRSFIDKGWTMLPTEKVVRKMNVYRMRPAHPEFDWFEHNKNKRLLSYDTGERLAEFDDDGRCHWYYKNQRQALLYYEAEELNAQQRFVIYSNGEPDERGRPRPYTILATFDYLGNGIVFDHSGKIRMKYNQSEGVILDRNIGPVSHWKWHTLNDPPVLQQVMIDTQKSYKDPEILKMGTARDSKLRPDNEDMLAIEFDNFIKEKSKKLSQSFKPFQIKMKALKINENFSLKVMDQANVYLIFRDGTTNIKLNLGMLLDHKEIVDTDTAEVGEVASNMERLPARTDSLAAMQKSVAYAQKFERSRTERDRRLQPPAVTVSADRLHAAASRPMRLPLYPAYSSTTTSRPRSRKPSTPNVYYDNRL